MQPQRYCHTIRFRGSAHPQGRYQLQIFEVKPDGQLQYRAQWTFATLKSLMGFLNHYFPRSQSLTSSGSPTLGFDQVPSMLRSVELQAA